MSIPFILFSLSFSTALVTSYSSFTLLLALQYNLNYTSDEALKIACNITLAFNLLFIITSYAKGFIWDLSDKKYLVTSCLYLIGGVSLLGVYFAKDVTFFFIARSLSLLVLMDTPPLVLAHLCSKQEKGSYQSFI